MRPDRRPDKKKKTDPLHVLPSIRVIQSHHDIIMTHLWLALHHIIHPSWHYSSPLCPLTNPLPIILQSWWLCCFLVPDSYPLADWASWHHSDSLCFALFILLLSSSILCLHDVISAYFLLVHPCLLICLLIPFTQHPTQPLPFAYSPLLSLLPILYKLLTNFLPST